jgi:hypothetical protein
VALVGGFGTHEDVGTHDDEIACAALDKPSVASGTRAEQPHMTKTPDYFARVALTGERVRLEPLSQGHFEQLSIAGGEAEIWRWLPSEHYTPDSMAEFVSSALSKSVQRKAVPFATIDMTHSIAVGSTRYHNIEPEHRRLEIGFTWISPMFQRSHVNTEAKYIPGSPLTAAEAAPASGTLEGHQQLIHRAQPLIESLHLSHHNSGP